MKKILLTGLTLILTSCTELVETKTETCENQITRTKIYANEMISTSKFTIYKFEYEGHTYLYFLENYGESGYAGLTHDENCKCRKQNIVNE